MGAAPTSLGAHIAMACRALGFATVTAGIEEEELHYDVTSPYSQHEAVMEWAAFLGPIHHVVCTAGINRPTPAIADPEWDRTMAEHMDVNVTGVVKMFTAWKMVHLLDETIPGFGNRSSNHFVAISSNSAHIARRQSLPYCVSKAALSMALRCLGRENAEGGPCVYGYEPGWLEGTPMSRETANLLGHTSGLHRIPGGAGVKPEELAEVIAHNLTRRNRFLNGTMLRLDGGEQ